MTYQKVSASGLILNNDGKVLMVKRAEDDEFLPGVFELPGGGTDFMEDPAEGLLREIKEECGVHVDVKYPLTAFSFKMPHEGVEKHTVEIIYLCHLKKEQPINLSFEHTDYKWLTFEEISTMTENDFMVRLITNLKTHPLISA